MAYIKKKKKYYHQYKKNINVTEIVKKLCTGKMTTETNITKCENLIYFFW